MVEIQNNAYFWQKLTTLLMSSDLVITNKQGSTHSQYPNLIYPTDYGYICDTNVDSGPVVKAFKGTNSSYSVKDVIVSVDILKRDIDVKLLLGCTDEEIENVLLFLNQTDFQKTILVSKGDEIPNWAESN
ncbi:MAG: Inorganic pyrophosphatase [Erysipelotrichaceae bacterium]